MTFLIEDIAIIGLSLMAAIIVASVIFRFLLSYTKRLTKHTNITLDDKIITALEKPIYLATILIGLNFGVSYTSFKASEVTFKLFEVAAILLVTYALFRILDGFLSWYKEEIEKKHKGTLVSIVPTVRRIARIIIGVLGATMVLNTLGIAITPILAAFGIGGLAIALAFQETLGNFFAGVFITIDRPLKAGDYIKLGDGLEGYIVSIGWRSTQIRTLPNNLVVIPNSKLAQSTVTNYYLPTKDMSVVIPCSVAYNSDLKKVEKITIDVARAIQRTVKGAAPEFDPFIRYNSFGDNGINFSIILRVQEFVDQYLVVHEFVKELQERYAKEGIEIPFPQRTVHLVKNNDEKLMR